ncbi:uncharacterized protein LOC117573523 isoform X1 [Drosophila albomicans]|uniref:Uncharacterized protein LOC117573523 isoform X1 n=1 Tax=Drosophila albomicans TaxID=7291 RepID=A0A6P8XIE7_DROAB|nr:uncharacterized protein LOC117573523 isoform X2 [Drosophila albomicans]XP_051863114.1 uncharacterized protein LOC117573523 isoform X1 [Drosophila albomicans]
MQSIIISIFLLGLSSIGAHPILETNVYQRINSTTYGQGKDQTTEKYEALHITTLEKAAKLEQNHTIQSKMLILKKHSTKSMNDTVEMPIFCNFTISLMGANLTKAVRITPSEIPIVNMNNKKKVPTNDTNIMPCGFDTKLSATALKVIAGG